jgi:hypothetical protein
MKRVATDFLVISYLSPFFLADETDDAMVNESRARLSYSQRQRCQGEPGRIQDRGQSLWIVLGR